ncbi:MAG TPA: DUF5357 family protein [Coleofasciculaceae cyanobacterium]
MQFLLNIYTWLRTKVSLPSAFSWETLIVLALFSYYMSILASSWVKELLVNFGWIFLILGVFWGTTASNQLRIGYKTPAQPGFPLSPWITGALVSIYIFGVLLDNETGEISREILVYWPVISGIIALIPDYVGDELKLKFPPPEKRLQEVLLLSSQVLISCWFQFHFVVQDYVAQYPSLIVDDFRKSAFVVKWDAPLYSPLPRGAAILDAMTNDLRNQLDTRSWSVLERLLLQDERQRLIETTAAQAKQRLSPVQEDELWVITSNVSSRGSGYNLDLQAMWQGPRSNDQPYTVTKSCQITQINRGFNPANKPLNTNPSTTPTAISRFDCQPVKGWGVEEPILASQ